MPRGKKRLPRPPRQYAIGIQLEERPDVSMVVTRRLRVLPPVGAGTVADLAVTLNFGGGSIATFTGENAVDMGDFAGTYVRQKSFLALNTDFPDWRVWFRVDADANGNRIVEPANGWRDEVIVEYGSSGVANGLAHTTSTPAHRLTSYDATITKNRATVYQYTVPKHWWYARWRYQSSQRPVVRTVSQLRVSNWIPNYGPEGAFGLTASDYSIPWNGPFCDPHSYGSSYGFQNIMANPGANSQIGYLTEAAADYVMFGTSLTTVMTEGEWQASNWCICVRDDASAAPIAVATAATGWPYGLTYKSYSGTVNNVPTAPSDVSFVRLDGEHTYPCATLPWLLTEDPYFLEALQFIVNYDVFAGAYHRVVTQQLAGLFYPGSIRMMAWSMRDMFTTYLTMPVNVPSWLLPKSYFQSVADDNKTYVQRHMDSPARMHAMFKIFARIDFTEDFMRNWVSAVVGQGVLAGASDWAPQFAWLVDREIQMTNGTSGWPREVPWGYYTSPWKAGWVQASMVGPATDTSKDADTCTSWADYWNYYGVQGSPEAVGFPITLTQSGGVATATMQSDYRNSIAPNNDIHYNKITGAANAGYNQANAAVITSPTSTTFTYAVPSNTPSPDSATYWPCWTDGTGGPISYTPGTISLHGHPQAGGVTRYPALDYWLHLRSVIALAVSNNISGAAACYNWLQPQMANTLVPTYPTASLQKRFAVDPLTSPLSTLAPGKARNLGPFISGYSTTYGDPTYLWKPPGLYSYSGLAYDPVGKRLLIHGGGHDDGMYNGIRQLDLLRAGQTGAWSDLVSAMTSQQQANAVLPTPPGNLDLGRGMYNLATDATRRPIAGHSYQGNIVLNNKFYHLQPGSRNDLHDGNGTLVYHIPTNGTGSPWWYDISAGIFWPSNYYNSLVYGSPITNWGVDGVEVCADLISGKILVTGGAGGWIGLYQYTPATVNSPPNDSTTTGLLYTNNGQFNGDYRIVGSGGSMMAAPDQGDNVFYRIANCGSDGRDEFGNPTPYRLRVWKIVLNRTTFTSTTMTLLSPNNTPPAGTYNYRGSSGDYDIANRVILTYIEGGANAGQWWAFDPATRLWAQKTITLEPGSVGTPVANFWCLKYDPNSGCFIGLDGANNTSWAVRIN